MTYEEAKAAWNEAKEAEDAAFKAVAEAAQQLCDAYLKHCGLEIGGDVWLTDYLHDYKSKRERRRAFIKRASVSHYGHVVVHVIVYKKDGRNIGHRDYILNSLEERQKGMASGRWEPYNVRG